MSSPDYSQWPQSSDIESALRALKVWPTDTDEQGYVTTQATIQVNAVAQEVENITGYHPFLAVRETRYFDATDGNGVLWLDSGLLSVGSISVAGGAPLVANTGYWLRGSKKPYSMVTFAANYYGGLVWSTPNQIAIDGDWGYSYTVPADLWAAVKDMATLQTLIAMQGAPDIASRSQEGLSIAYDLVGPIDDKTRLKAIPDRFDAVVEKYKRVVC